MARLIIVSDSIATRQGTITLEERVVPAHLEDGHSAAQLIERVGWAILDAEDLESSALTAHRAGPVPPERAIRGWRSRSGRALAV